MSNNQTANDPRKTALDALVAQAQDLKMDYQPTQTTTTLLKPGSDEAAAAGCQCPRIDNGRGRGYLGQSGIFVISEDCPIHTKHFEKAIDNC